MNDDKSQTDKFKELARELECDEDEGRWEQRLRAVMLRDPKADTAMPESGPPTTR